MHTSTTLRLLAFLSLAQSLFRQVVSQDYEDDYYGGGFGMDGDGMGGYDGYDDYGGYGGYDYGDYGGGTEEMVDETFVTDITGENFESFVTSNNLSMVEFYAPWCGHCKELKPAYARAALRLSKNGVALGKVDATVEEALAARFGVEGFPVIKIFRHTFHPEDYEEGRSEDEIVSFMRAQPEAGIGALEVTTLEELQEVVLQNGYSNAGTVVGFLSTESDDKQAFLDIANELQDDFPFVFTTSESLKSHYKYAQNALAVFKPPQRINVKYEKPKSRYPSKKLSVQAVRKFAEEAQIPLVAERNANTESYFSSSKKPVFTTFFDVEFAVASADTDTIPEQDQGKVKLTSYYLNRVRRVASRPELKSKLLFSIGDLESNINQIESIDTDNSKTVSIIESDGETFVMKDDFSMEAVESFVAAFLNGKLTAVSKDKNTDNSLDMYGEL